MGLLHHLHRVQCRGMTEVLIGVPRNLPTSMPLSSLAFFWLLRLTCTAETTLQSCMSPAFLDTMTPYIHARPDRARRSKKRGLACYALKAWQNFHNHSRLAFKACKACRQASKHFMYSYRRKVQQSWAQCELGFRV